MITTEQAQKILNSHYIKKGIKLSPSVKLYRGISPNSGNNAARFGTGLYFTADKNVAKEFAGSSGKIIEIPHNILPKNAIRFASRQNFELWEQYAVFDVLGYNRKSEFYSDYPDFKSFIHDLDSDIDGIQLYTGKDSEFVSFNAPKINEEKLTEFINTNSNNKPLAYSEEGISNFWKWFGNSVVKDERGNPLVLYHGTSSDIDKFEKENGGAGSRESKLGYWFTENVDAANGFAEFARGNAGRNILPVYLKIERPWYIKDYSELQDFIDKHTIFERPNYNIQGRQMRMVFDKVDYDAAVSELKTKYDGVILKNTRVDSPDGGETLIDQYVVLDKNQIKSAVSNSGNYSSDRDEIHEDVLNEDGPVIDNGGEYKGLGATGYNVDIKYHGIRVKMTPRIFLKMARSLGRNHSDYIENYIRDGNPIGSPFLIVYLPTGWTEGDFSQHPVIIGHEGRNRMSAIAAIYGSETPVEVHIIGRMEDKKVRATDFTPEIIEQLNKGMESEGERIYYKGPLFTTNLTESVELTEGRDYPLYHYMYVAKAENIFENNLMPARWQHEIIDVGTISGNSFSRNKNFRMNIRPIRLTMNHRKLSQTHKMIPLDGERVYRYGILADRLKYGNYYNDRVMNSDVSNQLAEEFVVGDIKNLNKYIDKIELNYMYGNSNIEKFNTIELVVDYAKKYNISLTISAKLIKDIKDRLELYIDAEEYSDSAIERFKRIYQDAIQYSNKIEEAAPSQIQKNKKYYHGTKSKEAAESIWENGLDPAHTEIKYGSKKPIMRPVAGKVYLAPDVAYASAYAIGGAFLGHNVPSEFDRTDGYMLVFDGNDLKDIQPDEDSVGHFMWAYHNRESKYIQEKLSDIINSPYVREVYRRMGYYIAASTIKRLDDAVTQTKIGKVLLKQMTDDEKLAFVDLGAHVAHDGKIKPIEMWRIDLSKVSQYKKDGSDFFEFSELIKKRENVELNEFIRAPNENLKAWAKGSEIVNSDDTPMILYHGTGDDINKFSSKFVIWGSEAKQLANEYTYIHKTPSVMPIYMKASCLFDANKLDKTVTIESFAKELYLQAKTKPNEEEFKNCIHIIKKSAKEEESGPYYNVYNFWYHPRDLFGKEGANKIRELFILCGFDGIKFIESGYMTYGVFDPKQVKSALGNNGNFNSDKEELTENSTIEKFWVSVKTGKIIYVEEEHDDNIGIDVPENPFENHWVRGGFSSYTHSYHLQSKDVKEMIRAIKILISDYTSDFNNIYYDINDGDLSGILNKESARNSIKNKSI